jgi:hypothetical protein
MLHERSWREGQESTSENFIRDVAEAFEDLIAKSGGAYSEELLVGPDGVIDANRRGGDSRLPFLPRLFLDENSREEPGGVRPPSVEELYKVIGELQRQSPRLRFEITEAPDRRSIRYTVRFQVDS